MTENGRKRRRGEVANPANTLDGLVARRADDGREPFQKRYLTEQEAIEGPDDEEEIKVCQSIFHEDQLLIVGKAL